MQFKAEQTGRENSVAGLCMTQMLYPADMQCNRSSRQSHMNRWKFLTNSLASFKTLSFYFPLTCFFEDDENFDSLKQQVWWEKLLALSDIRALCIWTSEGSTVLSVL